MSNTTNILLFQIGVSKFSLAKFLSTESEQLEWKAEGLPSDNLSVENALIILHGTRVPYLIDPSSRATAWLKEHLKDQRYVGWGRCYPSLSSVRRSRGEGLFRDQQRHYMSAVYTLHIPHTCKHAVLSNGNMIYTSIQYTSSHSSPFPNSLITNPLIP